jgi:hypothetical protein
MQPLDKLKQLDQLKRDDFKNGWKLAKALADIECFRREQAAFLIQKGIVKTTNQDFALVQLPNLRLSAFELKDFLQDYLKHEPKHLKKVVSDYKKFESNLVRVLTDFHYTTLFKILGFEHDDVEFLVENIMTSEADNLAVLPNLGFHEHNC